MSPHPLKTSWPNPGSTPDWDKLQKQAWLEQGMLIIKRDNPDLSWDIRHMIDSVGNALYGERK